MSRLESIAAGTAASLIAAGLFASAASGAPPAPPGRRSDLDALLWSGVPGSARIDQAGRALTPAALRDKVVVLAFVRADCLITCVIRTLDLDRAARALPEGLRGRVAFLALSTDPERDDAATLRRFAEGLSAEPLGLRVVTGDAATTAALAAWLRYPADRLPEPPPTVVAFDRRGQAAMSYGADPLDRERLLRDVAALDQFADGVGHPARAAGTASTP